MIQPAPPNLGVAAVQMLEVFFIEIGSHEHVAVSFSLGVALQVVYLKGKL